MQGPNIALRGEFEKIVVPTTNISLNTIITSIRGFLHLGRHQTVSGEVILGGSQAWLRLRIDGKEVYRSPNGFDPERPDDLLAAAAPAVVDKIQPYFVASALYDDDQQKALEKADAIIARLPRSDPNVEWSYVLKAMFYFEQKKFARAEQFAREALKLNANNWTAHNTLGAALRGRGKPDDAIVHYRRALALNPKFAVPHNNWGLALYDKGKFDEAIAQYSRAIEIDPNYKFAHNNWGLVLYQQGKFDEAIAQYRRAIEIDAEYTTAHTNLQHALARRKP